MTIWTEAGTMVRTGELRVSYAPKCQQLARATQRGRETSTLRGLGTSLLRLLPFCRFTKMGAADKKRMVSRRELRKYERRLRAEYCRLIDEGG